jgi:hypothetical protein
VTPRKKALTAKTTKQQERIDRWTALHFSLANPEGSGQRRLPRLLNRLAAEIRSLGEVDVLDITFHTEVTDVGNRPSFTVYYHRPGTSAR